MAIAFDNTAFFNCNNGTDNNAYVTTGSNMFMIVGASNDRNSSNSITYNGVSLTNLTTLTYAGNVNKLAFYYLAAPATGSNTLTVVSSPGANVAVVVATYSGVAQTGFPDSQNTGQISSTTITVSTTSVADNCWNVGVFGTATDATAYSAGTNTTIRSQGSSGGVTVAAVVDGNALIHPAGNTSLQVTPGPVGHGLAGIVVTLAPFVATAASSRSTLLMMGV